MREEHAVCVKFTQVLSPTKQDPADFELFLLRYKICLEQAG